MSEQVLETRVYELGYHVLPFVSVEDLENQVTSLKSHITKMGGQVFKESYPQMMDLAYEMSKTINNKRQKFNQAQFGWLKFELDPAKLLDLKKTFDKENNLLRYLLIQTVRQDTYIEGKKEEVDLPEASEEVVTDEEVKTFAHDTIHIPEEDINKEEVDKQIDDMVKES